MKKTAVLRLVLCLVLGLGLLCGCADKASLLEPAQDRPEPESRSSSEVSSAPDSSFASSAPTSTSRPTPTASSPGENDLTFISFIGESVSESTEFRKNISGVVLMFEGEKEDFDIGELTDIVMTRDGAEIEFKLPGTWEVLTFNSDENATHLVVDFQTITAAGEYQLSFAYRGETYTTKAETVV
ncbi:hypothetical protein LJB76_00345 [Clostridia bacterium OttesenSCG-928-O13]|nr:hypothetical protein [Clostridia bacterium OttesenSCG-928-O13]